MDDQTFQEQADNNLPVADLLKRIDTLQAEANTNKEHYLRTLADLENYRRRVIREKDDIRFMATSNILEDIVPVLDNLELGLKSAKTHNESTDIINGFQMVRDNLLNALKKNGIITINPVNEKFDPKTQECVAHIPHPTLEEETVTEVVRVGYKLGEKLIRPATVVVSSGAPTA